MFRRKEVVFFVAVVFACSSSYVVTLIYVDILENALNEYHNSLFVLKLCSDLRFGAHVCLKGPHTPKISRKLNRTIHTAGFFTNPTFANFQVSLMGIVSKKHSEKFCTISLIFPSPNPAVLLMLLFRKTISRYNASKLTMAQTHTWQRQPLNKPIVNF